MARTGAPTPAGLGQLRWRRAFKSRSKQVRSDRAQPPPGGPSGKLERDSVCRRPWGGSGGGEGRAITHAPSPALPARTRGGGGGRRWALRRPRAPSSARGAEGGDPEAGPPAPLSTDATRTTQGPGAKTGRGHQNLQTPGAGFSRRVTKNPRFPGASLSPFRFPEAKNKLGSLIGRFCSSDRSRRRPPFKTRGLSLFVDPTNKQSQAHPAFPAGKRPIPGEDNFPRSEN